MSIRNVESEMKTGEIRPENRGTGSILVPHLILIGSQIPLTFVYFLNLAQSRPHYRFFPLALVVFGVLLFLRWPRSGEKPFFPSYFSMLLLGLGLFLAACGTLWLSPWFGFAACLAFVGSLLARTNDHGQFGTLISLLTPLVVLLQPPTGIDFDNVQGDVQLMQMINLTSAAIASDFFDITAAPPIDWGYINLNTGSRIELPVGTIDSIDIGTRGTSVFTLLMLTAIYLAIVRRPLFRSVLLLLACVWWACFGETVEIVLCTIGASSFGLNWLDDNAPSWLRIVCLAVALVLTLLTDFLITFLFGKVDMTSIDEDAKFQYWICQSWNFVIAGFESPVIDNNVRREVAWARWRNSSPSTATSRTVWVAALACALLAVFQVIEIGRAGGVASRHALQGADSGWVPLSAAALPGNLLGADLLESRFVQPKRRTAFRVRENTWVYYDRQNESIRYEVSISQAWPGWHDALTNHERFEWLPDSGNSAGTTMRSGVIPDMPVVVNDYHNTIAEHSFLAVCQLDAFGEPLEPPLTWNNWPDFRRRATNRMNHRIRRRLLMADSIVIQMRVQTLGPVPDVVRRRALQLLEAAAATIQMQLAENRLPLDEPVDQP